MRTIGDVAELVMGQSPPGDTYNSEGVGLPFFQGKAEFGDVSPTAVKWCPMPSRIAEAGDILISVRAPVGPTNVASERCGIGRGLAAIRAIPNLADPTFLLYYFRHIEPELASLGSGSTFAAINRKDIETFRIPLPPLPEQRRIAAILRQADQLRRWRREADEKFETLLPAIFLKEFGYPQEWKANVPLGTLVDFVGGGTPSRRIKTYFTGDIPWATSKDIKSRYLKDAQEHITEEAIDQSATNLVPANTILSR